MVVPAGIPEFSTVTASPQNITTTMSAGNLYLFSTTTSCWIAWGSNPTASAAAGSLLVPAGTSLLIHGTFGPKLSILRDAADGKASIVVVRRAVS